jgi:hypothetical protein
MTEKALVNSTGKTLLQSPKVIKFLDLFADEAMPWRDAATKAGIRHSRARKLLRDPTINREWNRRIDVERQAERVRNIRAAIATRDIALTGTPSAAERKVALDAARYLDGDSGDTTINVIGNGNNVLAGYVVRLDGPATGPRAIGNRSASPSKPLIDNDGVPIDEV